MKDENFIIPSNLISYSQFLVGLSWFVKLLVFRFTFNYTLQRREGMEMAKQPRSYTTAESYFTGSGQTVSTVVPFSPREKKQNEKYFRLTAYAKCRVHQISVW